MLGKVSCAVFGLLVVFLLGPASHADEVTAAMLKADARLQTHVSIRSPHILIGELLERLSKQSGVTLTADEWSTVGSDSVTVSLHDVPLSDAMNAVWSLFSYQHAEWDWRRFPIKGDANKYAYTLARPNYARFLAERLQEQVQTDFEAQAQELFDALNMPMDQLKEAAKNNLLLSGLLDDGRVRPGMEILASLPPETLQNLLRNHQGIEIPVSSLSPEAQKALKTSWDWEDSIGVGHHYPNGTYVPEPRLDHISINIDTSPGDVAPTVYISSGRGSGGYFGGAYMQEAWQKMNAQWMLPGDGADSPASARALAASKKSAPTDDTRHRLADYLLKLSDAAQMPLMARLPNSMDTLSSSGIPSQVPSNSTLTASLAQAQESLQIDHKWRGSVLLMTCQSWFVGQSEDARLPWTEIKRLRDAEAAGDGFLTLDNIAHAANVLNDAQMTALGEWFPVMSQAAEWHDFLAFYDKTPEYHPHVLSAKGDDWQYPESLVNSQLGIDALRVTHPNRRLQIQQKQDTVNKPPAHGIVFVVRDDAGAHPINARTFFWTAHQYQASLQVSEKADAVVPATGKQSGAAK